jgi:hypothetical protein
MLPSAQSEFEITYGESEPEVAELGVTCVLWFYWIPPNFDTDDDPLDGMVFVAARATDVPDDAKAVQGNVTFPGGEPVKLNGNSIGPFEMRNLKVSGPGESCAFTRFGFNFVAPDGFQCRVKEPSPFLERCSDLGGCELQRLLECPVSIAYFRADPPPPLILSLFTACCASAWSGASISINGDTPVAFDNEGCVPLQRLRRGGQNQVEIIGVPPSLLPFQGKCQSIVSYGPVAPSRIDVLISCLLWIYWIDGGDKDEDDEDDEFSSNPGTVFIAASGQHIPAEALPVTGTINCFVAEETKTQLDGSSIGPFSFKLHPEEENERDLLTQLEFQLSPPKGFKYVQGEAWASLKEKQFSQTGSSCELQRPWLQRQLINCPIVLGTFSPLPQPLPRMLSLCTSCCKLPFGGARAAIEGGELQEFDDMGCLRLPRRARADRDGAFDVVFDGVPPHVLVSPYSIEYGSDEAKCRIVETECQVWIYWVPPVEDDEDDLNLPEGEEPELLNGMLFVAADSSHIPDEAESVVGTLRCPNSEAGFIPLNGSSMGPFFLPRAIPGFDEASFHHVHLNNVPCTVSSINVEIEAPDGFRYQAKDPSPLEERCQEFGGCEYQRLLACPQVVGMLIPIPVPPPKPRQLSLLTPCCGQSFACARVNIDGEEALSKG